MTDIDQLEGGLNSFPDGECVLVQLIAVGNPAVGSLTNFLFHSKPIRLRRGMESDEQGGTGSPQ